LKRVGEAEAAGWRFWIDRGGTFTDVIGQRPNGELVVEKVLSVQPDRRGDPAVTAIQRLLGLPPDAPIPAGAVREVRLGTTVATNALLERRGAPVLLLINRGLADLLEIGDQHRPELFALRIERPQPLTIRVLEVEGRLAADGRELEPLRCDEELRRQLNQALADGYRSVAVALLHAVRNPGHERDLGRWLEAQGVKDIALSHRLSAQPRLVPRGHTALVEAAVGPVLRSYLQQVRRSLGGDTPVRVMRSSGALATHADLLAKDTILSGPAGGMVGAVAVAMAVSPERPIVGFDMGGTSTDVFHFDPGRGEAAWERSAETTIEGLRLQAPMLPVHTVAAGGGSILRCVDGRLLVGPQSAGAVPGPAAYRRGGPATITDANLLLGRLPPEALPAVFGPSGDQPVDLAAVHARFAELAEATGLAPEAVAEGGLQVAIERMAAAIRHISIQRGHDIRGALLVSYGGAGGQHACRLAAQLGIGRVLLHPLSGVLSAYGIGRAEQRQLREQVIRAPLEPVLIPRLRQQIQELQQEAVTALQRSGDLSPGDPHRLVVRLELRFPGSERGLELLWPAQPSAAIAQSAVDGRRMQEPSGTAIGTPAGGERAGDNSDVVRDSGDAAAKEVAGRMRPGDRRSDPPDRDDEAKAQDSRLVEALRRDFAESHRRRFGYLPSDRALVVERLLLEVAAAESAPHPVRHGPAGDSAAQGTDTAMLPPASNHSTPSNPPNAERAAAPPPPAQTRVWLAPDGWQPVPLWRRSELPPAVRIDGPAVVTDATTTLMLEPQWSAVVLPGGELMLERAPSLAAMPNEIPEASLTGSVRSRQASAQQKPVQWALASDADGIGDPHAPSIEPRRLPGGCAEAAADKPHQPAEPAQRATTVGTSRAPATPGAAIDPVQLELFHHRFAAIAEQMGVQLQLSSRSVNIRERLDFSCALFDGRGALVANAPHIPVHLGSMGESVASLLADVAAGLRPPLAPGDVILSNDPYAGGTHLPDITAITPVFAAGAPAGEAPLFFVASRGHHADVGGITPGSMPAFSTAIEQEGLLLRNEVFLSGGVFDEAAWRRRLAAGPHPVRNPDQLLADLQAQVAANRQGVAALEQLIASEGQELVQAFMGHVQANAAEAVRRVVDRLQAGSHAVELDGGAWIQVTVTPDRQARRVRVDFTGTSPQLATNHNAPLAVTHAVVLYVFRCLVGEEIPLNAGCFEPIDLVVPPGCLLSPSPPAAVVAGNVETSQAACNALFGALGVQAAAQGTMNNLSFGDEAQGPASRQYYETICGGTGAGVLADGRGFAGASAVQSHMTNSRLTDPEILEERFPVRLEIFRKRRGSGGAGRWPGGDGVIRQLRALEPLRVSLLTGSRRVPPFGLAGGQAGACGANWLLRSGGSEETLPPCCEISLAAGEGLRIETPGGGGYGAPD
jgi:N-methylhydantoinase B/oxoprolinase/acetone carboxylase alpha subunit/N-methylhydantoinase A/oxoprolinase/acetone carboxylase beta subunit